MSLSTLRKVNDAMDALSVEPTMIRGARIQWPGGPAMAQNFSLPASIIRYIALNPENPEVYKKLIQSCKYFFEVNPILVAARLYEPRNFRSDNKTRICPKEEHANHCEINECCIEIDLNKLSSKLWLTHRLSIHGNYTPNFSSLLRQKLYQCDISELYLYETIIPFDDFKFLVQTVKRLDLLFTVKVLDEDGKIVKLDEILGVCPKIEDFRRDFIRNDLSTIAASTLKNIANLENLSNLKNFEMEMIPEIFDVQEISDFVTKHFSGANINLKFGPNTSAAFNVQLDAIREKIRESNIKNHTVSYITWYFLPRDADSD